MRLQLFQIPSSATTVVQCAISVGGPAKRFVPVDFLNFELRLATGPLHLARTSNAVLLPIFPVKQETGILVVNVEPPLIGGVGDATHAAPQG